MRYLVSIAALFFVFLPAAASADCSGDGCTNVQITRIWVYQDYANIRTSGIEDNLDCTPGTTDYLRMRRADPEYEDWYAMVLTAFNRETPVSIVLESGTGTCFVRYVYQDR